MNDEFYVGYLPVPPRLRRSLRWVAGGLGVLAAGAAVLLVAGQGQFAPASFEFGVTRPVAGVLRERPYPRIELGDGRAALLVAEGKHGAAELVKGLDGREAQFQASRIERDGVLMLELQPGSLQAGAAGPAAKRIEGRLRVTLTGEIVDSKCFLGVMNPGQGKVHKSCAVRCISGGVPPAFLVRDRAGEARLLLLTGARGEALRREVLEIRGRASEPGR